MRTEAVEGSYIEARWQEVGGFGNSRDAHVVFIV